MAGEEEGTLDMREPEYKPASIYDISFKDKYGKDVSMSEYKDKVVLIINVATYSPFSSNTYHELNNLYEKYNYFGLEILAFPCNQFAAQEPYRNEWIQETVENRFKVKFPVLAKVDVNGPNAATLYIYLKDKKNNGEHIRWNFTKFLIKRTGEIYERYPPNIPPYKLEEEIISLLGMELHDGPPFCKKCEKPHAVE